MILVDLSSLAFSAFYALNGKMDEKLYRHLLLNSLRAYNAKYREEYGQMVIAADASNYWRRAIFPHYKASRKTAREASDTDWNEVFRVMDSVRDEIRDFLPVKYLHIDTCEADDIIAVLSESTQEFGCSDKVLIVSSDGDFAQLQKYSNVRQLSPITKKFMGDEKPISTLREKILRGDGGDGIPNVLSADDCFVNHVRQTPLSSKKVNLWIEHWSKLAQLVPEQVYRNIQRNERLISFEFIPEDVKKKVLNTFEDCKTPPNSGVFTYLIEKRCGQLSSSAADFFPRN